MAGTTSDKLALLRQIKEAFRAAITGKGQTISDDEPYSAWPAKVLAIETGIQLPTLTSPGGAADLRKGKQLIDQAGQIVDGTLEEVQQATPSISVSSAGLITATAGDKSATKQLSTQSGKTITPGSTEQIAVAAGKYVTGDIIVAAVQSGGSGGFHTSNSSSSSLAAIDASGNLVIQPPTDIDITTISGVENFGVRIYKGDAANLEYREMLIVNYLSDLFDARYLHAFWSGKSSPQNASATLEEIVHSYCTVDFNETTKVLTLTPSNEMSLLDYGDPNIHIRVTYALH